MFWTRLLPFLNQPNWALRLRTIDTRTTALTQKGCVGCVNNGIGGEHLWSTRFSFCSKGQWRCFVCFRLLMAVGELCMFCTLQLRVLLSSKHSKSKDLSFGQSATPSLITHHMSQIILVLLLPSTSSHRD